MLSTKSTLCLLLLCLTVSSLIPDEEYMNEFLLFEARDGYLIQNKEEMLNMFGKEHLSFNRNSTQVSQVKPHIWEEMDRVLLMLEVRHSHRNCSGTRNVVFLLDTSAPFTVTSPILNKLILADCKLYEFQKDERLLIKINGRQILPHIAKNYYEDTNILGMDYIKANNIQFFMKINRFYHKRSILSFKFDSKWDEIDSQSDL